MLLFLLLLLLYVIYILYIYIYFPVSSHLALDFRGFVWTYCVCEIHQLIGGKHPIRVSNLRWWFPNHTQLGTQIQCFIISSCRFIEKNGSVWKKIGKNTNLCWFIRVKKHQNWWKIRLFPKFPFFISSMAKLSYVMSIQITVVTRGFIISEGIPLCY